MAQRARQHAAAPCPGAPPDRAASPHAGRVGGWPATA
jgi:hypothetical protein